MLRRAALLLHLCTAADPYERGIAAARKADLARAKASFTEAGETASALQALATLYLIDGDIAEAIAAAQSKGARPPGTHTLAVLFRDGHECGGLGDVYWSCAFLLKKARRDRYG